MSGKKFIRLGNKVLEVSRLSSALDIFLLELAMRVDGRRLPLLVEADDLEVSNP